MVIDGRQIAQTIKERVAQEVLRLKTKGIDPHLAVILVGDDPSSHTYVRRKKKMGADIGIEVSDYMLPTTTPPDVLLEQVKLLNQDPLIHGIIIQRPVPLDIATETLNIAVRPEKDVDGFHPTSPFSPPIVSAVLRILEWIHQKEMENENLKSKQSANLQPTTYNLQPFLPWLRKKKIVILGRGVTAGKPIADTLEKYTIPHTVAHSQTKNIDELCRSAAILISCVGRENIVRHHMVTEKTILIGVGLHSEDDHLAPDYDQKEMAGIVDYYTPVPGGVGPVNVACLLENVVIAAEKSTPQQ